MKAVLAVAMSLVFVVLATFRFRVALALYIGAIVLAVHNVAVFQGWSAIKVAFPMLLLGCWVSATRDRSGIRLDRELALWDAALLAVALLGLMTAGYRGAALASVWQFGGPMALGLIIAGGIRDTRALSVIVWVFVWCGTVSAAIAVAQAANSAVLEPVAQLTSATDGLDPQRAPGPFNDPNSLAAALSVAIPISAALFAYVKRLWRRIVLAVAMLLMSAGLILTYSRAGWLGVCVGFPILFIPRDVRRALIVPLVVLLGTGLALYFGLGAGDSLFGTRLGQLLALDTLSGVNSFAERIALWHKAIAIAEKHPVLGIGFGNFPSTEIAGMFRWVGGKVTHNMFLTVLAEMGIVGLGLLISLIVRVFGNLASAARARTSHSLSLMSWGLLSGVVSYVAGFGMAQGSAVSELMWVLIGLSFAVRALAAEAPAVGVAPSAEA